MEGQEDTILEIDRGLAPEEDILVQDQEVEEDDLDQEAEEEDLDPEGIIPTQEVLDHL